MIIYSVKYSNMTDAELCHEFRDSSIFIVQEFSRRLSDLLSREKEFEELQECIFKQINDIEKPCYALYTSAEELQDIQGCILEEISEIEKPCYALDRSAKELQDIQERIFKQIAEIEKACEALDGLAGDLTR